MQFSSKWVCHYGYGEGKKLQPKGNNCYSIACAMGRIPTVRLKTVDDLLGSNQYLNGHDQWIDTAHFPPDKWYGSPQDFAQDFEKKFGYLPDGFSAFGAVAPLVLQEAIRSAKTLTQEGVRFALSRLDLDLFYGRIFFSVDNGCLHGIADA